MPNWCNNYIEIEGVGVSKIKEILEANPLGSMFELLVGKYAEGQTEEEYQQTWYDTNCDRWGCKWDVEIDLDSINFFEDHFMSMNLQTAWSPCNDFLRLLHQKYSVFVKNDYSETGNDFAGTFEIDEDGEVDNCYSYLEGLYHSDYDYFIMEVQNQIEYLKDDNEDEIPSVDEWLKEFPYASMDCLVELQEMFILEMS
jgi:hypothetical protein